ncbi:DUF397 domain-containing protein [Thermomonospora umbrina]|uniref:Uncharacterized protein DUF397 n=1 Tax=Thermomonospora umbrina TaxID=111806 RepID=A0A3D9SUS1_9ACTN|nr:DUF397 domain-containing protein [Thermomonospora umbrina]REE96304.1 uncharacterized protein DUF397 [Thermomonospora umbrina]
MKHGEDPSRPQWRKSSRSVSNGQCAEVARLGTVIAVRDSKSVETGGILVASAGWRALLDGIKSGRYDL